MKGFADTKIGRLFDLPVEFDIQTGTSRGLLD
jgi:hypothetical protein